jgi:type VI secretion system secreted protein Hcp
MATDFFLDIPDIPGESTDDKFKGKIDLISWSWGEANSGTAQSGGGGGSGKVSAQDFHFVKKMDKSSPLIAQSCATGKHFAKGQLICRKAGGNQLVYFTTDFTEFLISSYQVGASSGSEEVPTEQVSLNFSKVLWAYTIQDEKGGGKTTEKKGYDFGANKSF